MGEVQGGDRRLADIGVSLPGQRAEPGVDGVDRLDHGGEVPALHHLLDVAQFLVGAARVVVEAGIRQSWDRLLGENGQFVGMSSFGASAPAGELYKKFGITAEGIVAAAKSAVSGQ